MSNVENRVSRARITNYLVAACSIAVLAGAVQLGFQSWFDPVVSEIVDRDARSDDRMHEPRVVKLGFATVLVPANWHLERSNAHDAKFTISGSEGDRDYQVTIRQRDSDGNVRGLVDGAGNPVPVHSTPEWAVGSEDGTYRVELITRWKISSKRSLLQFRLSRDSRPRIDVSVIGAFDAVMADEARIVQFVREFEFE